MDVLNKNSTRAIPPPPESIKWSLCESTMDTTVLSLSSRCLLLGEKEINLRERGGGYQGTCAVLALKQASGRKCDKELFLGPFWDLE